MEKVLSFVAIFLTVVILFGLVAMIFLNHMDSVYGTVENINDDIVALVDTDGEMWIYEKENEDFEIGEKVEIIFYDNFTADLYDDEIVEIVK